jgi:exodeoxyribonuclease V gamma subunit
MQPAGPGGGLGAEGQIDCEQIPLTAKLRIHTSPRLEELFERLSTELESVGADPLAPTPIVVPSQGLARWLQSRWAQRWGIAAGFDYLFPGQWARRLGRELGIDPRAGVEGEDPFDTPALSLRIFECLPELASSFDELESYLGEDSSQRRRQQLAEKLARNFGEWQLFRPDVLVEWEAGRVSASLNAQYRHEGWVAELWRALCDAPVEGMPLGRLLLELRDQLREPGAAKIEAVRVFGASSLPPLLVQLMRGVAEHSPVSIYFPAPTRDYWSDLRSERQQRRDELREPSAEFSYDPRVPALLANFGAQGRDFFALLAEIDEEGGAWDAIGEEFSPTPTSVLQWVQSEVEGGGVEESAPTTPIDFASDDSLRLHSCHSPRRELEVLRDRIWQAFADDADLAPSDVLVLVPDMQRYSPFVRTVFDETITGLPTIPFTLADRRWEDEEPVLRCFLRILDLGRGRRSSLQLLDLLDTSALARGFGFDEAMVARARELVRDLGIRWGSDPDQRARDWQLPSYGGASWREGLDAALFGALSGEVDAVVDSIFPAGDIAPATLEVTARLSRFVRTLGQLWDDMQRPRSLSEWCRRVERVLDEFFLAEGDREVDLLARLRRSLEELAQSTDTWRLREDWSDVAFVAILRERLETSAPVVGFLSGAVTFAEMRPLRSLPFPFLAVLGLDEAGFPRLAPRDSLDLLSLERRRGDRSSKEDDRYLFLETIMAARGHLHLSAVARSERDGSERGRSVVLDELLDALRRRFGRAAEQCVVHHHLHGFHPEYFSAPASPATPRTLQRSFDTQAARAAAVVVAPRVKTPSFWSGTDVDRDLPTEISLEDLLRFWKDPAKWFCRDVLGLQLYEENEAAEEECLSLDALDKWKARELVLRARHQVPSPAEMAALERRLGLPATASTEVQLHSAMDEAQSLRQWWEETPTLEDLTMSVSVDMGASHRVEIAGVLRGLSSIGLRRMSASKFKLGEEIAAAIGLALLTTCESLPAQLPLRSWYHSREDLILLERNDHNANDLRKWLKKVVEIYRGAHRQPVYLALEVAKGLRDSLDDGEGPVGESHVREFLASSNGRSCLEGVRDRFPGLYDDDAWSVLLGPSRDLSPIVCDVARHYEEVVRPMKLFRAEMSEAST